MSTWSALPNASCVSKEYPIKKLLKGGKHQLL